MNPVYALIASRLWAAEPTALHAWASGKESHGKLVAAGMTPRERAMRAVNGESTVGIQRNGSTATIPIEGVLMHAGPWWAKMDGDATDYLDIRSALEDVAQDVTVKDVVLAINSPGGDAVGLAATVEWIGKVREAGKTISAHISGMGCSAAYFLASATDQITAEPDALVGSIGTMTVLRDTTGLQDKIGIRLEVVSSGPDKGAGADGKVTPEYRAQVQRRVDAFASMFREQVANGRKMTAEQVAAVSTGDYWIAGDAQARGLIDGTTNQKRAPKAAPTITPAASQAATTSNEESAMDLKLKAKLAALCQEHPTHAAVLVAKAMEDGATESALQSHADAIVAKAKDDAHAAEVADLKAKLAAAEKARDEFKAEAEKAKAEKAHAAPADPGADPHAAETMTREKFAAMSPTEQAEYVAKHGPEAVK